MSDALPFAYVSFDGAKLDSDPHAGRRLRIDARCLAGEPVKGAYASVCALPDRDAALRFDEPEVQQVRRDALAWWIPLLGDELICISTCAVDASRFAGALTAARSKDLLDQDRSAGSFRNCGRRRLPMFCTTPVRPCDRALCRSPVAGRILYTPCA